MMVSGREGGGGGGVEIVDNDGEWEGGGRGRGRGGGREGGREGGRDPTHLLIKGIRDVFSLVPGKNVSCI